MVDANIRALSELCICLDVSNDAMHVSPVLQINVCSTCYTASCTEYYRTFSEGGQGVRGVERMAGEVSGLSFEG